MAEEKIKKGQQVLDSDYSEFSATDPFNPRNHVEAIKNVKKMMRIENE